MNLKVISVWLAELNVLSKIGKNIKFLRYEINKNLRLFTCVLDNAYANDEFYIKVNKEKYLSFQKYLHKCVAIHSSLSQNLISCFSSNNKTSKHFRVQLHFYSYYQQNSNPTEASKMRYSDK